MNSDMSKYSREHFENALNIGWNWRNESYTKKQDNDLEFMEKLLEFCKEPVNISRAGDRIYTYDEEKKETYIYGLAEIRILDIENNIRYAAPNYIHKNIEIGSYYPPDFFIEVVKKAPLPSDKEYKEFMKRYNEECYWGESEEMVEKIKNVEYMIENDKQAFYEYLKEKENLDIITKNGSLLNYSIVKKDIVMAKKIIESGIDINAFGGYELNKAIRDGLTEIAELLINKNIQVNNSRINLNALFGAAFEDNDDIVLKLLEKYPELNVRYYSPIHNKFSILDVFKLHKNDKMIEILEKKDLIDVIKNAPIVKFIEAW